MTREMLEQAVLARFGPGGGIIWDYSDPGAARGTTWVRDSGKARTKAEKLRLRLIGATVSTAADGHLVVQGRLHPTDTRIGIALVEVLIGDPPDE